MATEDPAKYNGVGPTQTPHTNAAKDSHRRLSPSISICDKSQALQRPFLLKQVSSKATEPSPL